METEKLFSKWLNEHKHRNRNKVLQFLQYKPSFLLEENWEGMSVLNSLPTIYENKNKNKNKIKIK